MLDQILAVVRPQLGGELVSVSQVGGGDFAQAYKLDLDVGTAFFLKTHANPPAKFFTTESYGLSWLRESAAVNVPEVIAVQDNPPFLLMEWIDIGQAVASTERAFGRELARLHQFPQKSFGRADSRTTGSLAVPNERCTSWAEFYCHKRLLPLMNIARDRQIFKVSTLANIEKVATRLDRLGVPEEKPALLHGDLWAGNRMVDINGKSWLIDPAAHCGHREFDLAMMQLFGGFGDDCYAAYHEKHPLESNWRDRVLLHQLAPLIVHAIKFGGHYISATESALKKYL